MTIKLIDIYSGSEFAPAKWKADGLTGVIMRAGQGSWADIPRLHPEWAQQARDAGLLVGWYWVCDSRTKSADHINAMEKVKLFDDKMELGLWVDVEPPYIGMKEAEYRKTPYAGYKNIVDMVYLLRLRNVRVGVYTSPGMFALCVGNAPQGQLDYLAQVPLWTAQYYNVYIEGVSKPKLYGAWKSWTLWQYRESPDLNIFNGSDAAFSDMFGVSQVVIPPTDNNPPPVTEDEIESVTIKYKSGKVVMR